MTKTSRPRPSLGSPRPPRIADDLLPPGTYRCQKCSHPMRISRATPAARLRCKCRKPHPAFFFRVPTDDDWKRQGFAVEHRGGSGRVFRRPEAASPPPEARPKYGPEFVRLALNYIRADILARYDGRVAGWVMHLIWKGDRKTLERVVKAARGERDVGAPRRGLADPRRVGTAYEGLYRRLKDYRKRKAGPEEIAAELAPELGLTKAQRDTLMNILREAKRDAVHVAVRQLVMWHYSMSDGEFRKRRAAHHRAETRRAAAAREAIREIAQPD